MSTQFLHLPATILQPTIQKAIEKLNQESVNRECSGVPDFAQLLARLVSVDIKNCSSFDGQTLRVSTLLELCSGETLQFKSKEAAKIWKVAPPKQQSPLELYSVTWATCGNRNSELNST